MVGVSATAAAGLPGDDGRVFPGLPRRASIARAGLAFGGKLVGNREIEAIKAICAAIETQPARHRFRPGWGHIERIGG